MAIPDAVKLVRDYLAALHPTIPVVNAVPNPLPAEFIEVRRVGGFGLRPVRDLVVLDIWCWAATAPRAMQLGSDVRAEMFALARTTLLGVDCYRVNEVLFRQQDDDETGTPRCWGTYELTLRADEVLPA